MNGGQRPSGGDNHTVELPGRHAAALSAVAWHTHVELNQQEWVEFGRRLGRLGIGANWWLGDWIRYGNARYGQRYRLATKLTGYDRQTLMNCAYVSSRIEVSVRREDVSWSHHAALAALDTAEQRRWLERIAVDRLSLRDLRLELRATRSRDTSAVGAHVAPARDSARGLRCPACGQPLRGGTALRRPLAQHDAAPDSA
jgi:hypothetical protein